MPEIPEIASRAHEMNRALTGKTISLIEVLQPKSLNLPADEFCQALTNAMIEGVTYHGKWIKVRTTAGWLLINLGMGGEILLAARDKLPEKYRLIFDFADDSCLTINFWWFGYVYYCPLDELNSIKMIAKLGPNVLDLTAEQFYDLVKAQKPRTRIKVFLLDQSNVAGIGNAYIHDILFLAGLHPLRVISSLSDADIFNLYTAVHDGLEPSLAKGGAFFESDLFGQKGGFKMEDILVGYRAGKPCPNCGAPIEKIRTGGTSSFICPECQPLLK